MNENLLVGNLTTITRTIESLGVMHPNKKFIGLFFLSEENPRGPGKTYYCKFTFEEMQKIFIEGNYKKLSDDYWEAAKNLKKAEDNINKRRFEEFPEEHWLQQKQNFKTRCSELFTEACNFVPVNAPS